ncbi:MAG: hypothetical protein KAH44_10065 [Oricola sp.]|nr:hypothetical protein [Oricola sp.]
MVKGIDKKRSEENRPPQEIATRAAGPPFLDFPLFGFGIFRRTGFQMFKKSCGVFPQAHFDHLIESPAMLFANRPKFRCVQSARRIVFVEPAIRKTRIHDIFVVPEATVRISDGRPAEAIDRPAEAVDPLAQLLRDVCIGAEFLFEDDQACIDANIPVRLLCGGIARKGGGSQDRDRR